MEMRPGSRDHDDYSETLDSRKSLNAMSEDIKYSAILQGNELKAEVGSAARSGPNLRDVALSIASQASTADVACVTTNQVTGYYIKRTDGIICVAISNDNAPPRIVLSFLKKVDEKITAVHNNPSEYKSILESVLKDTSNNRDSIQMAQGEMDRVKQIMVENIDRLLERGERVNLLVDRTGEMSQSANIFNRQATQLQRKFWFQNVKTTMLIGSVAAVALFASYRVFLR